MLYTNIIFMDIQYTVCCVQLLGTVSGVDEGKIHYWDTRWIEKFKGAIALPH